MFEYDGPKYRLVMDRIKEDMATGKLRAGDRMPTVRKIRDTHKIGHATAAKVLAELCREGYAYVDGNATYVKDRDQAEVTLYTVIQGGRKRGSTNTSGLVAQPGWGRVTEAGIVVPPDYVCDVMQLPRGTPVLRRETIESYRQMMDGDERRDPPPPLRPTTLAVYWHPAEWAELLPELLNVGLTDATSPMVYLGVGGIIVEQQLERDPRRGLDSFHGRRADEREAGALEIPIGDPVLGRVTTWQDDAGVTEYREAVHPTGVVVSIEHRDPFDGDPD